MDFKKIFNQEKNRKHVGIFPCCNPYAYWEPHRNYIDIKDKD